MNSKAKGNAGERELAGILREHGYDTRRGQQFSGANGDADVIGLPGIHIECKRVEKLNIDKAMSQSVRDSYAEGIKTGGEVFPAVFHRANSDRKKDSTRGVWKVTMRLDDWMELYKAWDMRNLPF